LKYAALDGLYQVVSKSPTTARHHPEHITPTQGEVVARVACSRNIRGMMTPLKPYAYLMLHYFLVSGVLDLMNTEHEEYETDLLMVKYRV
jgi:hypothetical protein